jgi:hypothetical protein
VPKRKTTSTKAETGERLGGSIAASRIELQAAPEWIAKLDKAAAAMGLSRSAYIRMACNRQMTADAKERR